MAFHVMHRSGGMEADPPLERLHEVLAELDFADEEHPDVSLTHESDWSLSVFPDGLVIWEQLEEGDTFHMNDVSRDKTLDLWLKLSRGQIAVISDRDRS